MPDQVPPDELRATHLLPPDAPAEEPPRKIAERRVVGWAMANRLITRFDRRPCGNSRRFWKHIEDDDPFLPPPVLKRVRQDHRLYPAERMDRIPSTAIPQDKPAPREPTPQARRAAPTPQAPPPPTQTAPKAMHTPTHRVAPSPLPPRPTPEPTEPPPPIDRRPPIIPRGDVRGKAGRIRVSRATQRPQGQTGVVQPNATSDNNAAIIRARKEKEREAGTTKDYQFKNRGLDDVLSIMGQLATMEKLHADGLLEEDQRVHLPDEPVKIKAKAPTPPSPAAHKPPPKPAPEPQPAPQPAPVVDRTPPAPPSKPQEEPAKPGRPASAGNMNDLFGGNPNEGRVRIGKRQKPKKD